MRRRVSLSLFLVAAGCALPRPMQPRSEEWAALLEAGDGLRRRGELDEAESVYRQLIARDNGSVRGHVGLQEVLRAQGLELELRKAYAGARPYLKGRLEGDPQEKRAAYQDAAEPYRSMGLGLWERSRALDAGQSWTRVALGHRYLAGGRLGLAESEFSAALWTDRGHPTAAYGLSLVASRRGDYRGALEWARRAYELGPGHEAFARRLYRLAKLSRDAGTRDAAASLLAGGGEKDLLLAGKLGGEKSRGYLQQARRGGASRKEVKAERPRAAPAAMRKFVKRFSRGVRMRYRHYAATGEAESFAEFVDWARILYVESTGRPLRKLGKIERIALVGELVDPSAGSDEPLVREFARHDLLLLLGRRNGGPPEALIAEIVRRDALGPIESRGTTVDREAVWTGARYLSGYLEWAGRGDVAGLALMGFLVIDEDAIARWDGEIRRVRKRLQPYRARILAQEAVHADDPTSIKDPAGVAERLKLVGDLAVAEEVRIHEEAHLVDAALHLPIGDHLFRNLGLAISSGFSPQNVLAFFERNAQLTAIADGPAPRSALATCCATLGGRGPHAQGYAEIIDGMVRAIAKAPQDYPEVDTERVIVQQLHRLPAAKVRALAKQLMQRWRVAS